MFQCGKPFGESGKKSQEKGTRLLRVLYDSENKEHSVIQFGLNKRKI